MALSRYQPFTRAEWARLRADMPLTLTEDDLMAVATRIWREINEPNLLENILPTRDRAHLVLRKGPDHAVQQVRLRKL